MTAYERALQELGRAAPKDFVTERKRLAAALRARDEGAAARLEQRRKPTASVWAVNQLYWRERQEFDRLLAAAASLRKGDIDARRAYRDALSALHQAAARLLKEGGLGAADATLRRIATSLAAIAAAGGFGAEPAGALEKDLEAPGFEAMGAPAREVAREAPASPSPEKKPRPRAIERADRSDRKPRAADERARRREEIERARAEKTEQKRRARENAERDARRDRRRRELESAMHVAAKSRSTVDALRQKLRDAEQKAREAQDAVKELQGRLDAE